MKLGILGGTFDPIHLGHLHMARAALEEGGLDSLLLLPDGDPPHKTPSTRDADRLRMVRIAISDEPRFFTSDMEMKRRGRTYTVDTLLALKKEAPARELIYVIGSDTLFLFPTWRTAGKVAELCTMLVVMREGDEVGAVRAEQANMQREYGLISTLLKTRGLPISSSLVRETRRKGGDISGLVPPGVAEYIMQRGLYLGEGSSPG